MFVPDANTHERYYLNSVYWAIICALYKKRLEEPGGEPQGPSRYNIYVDAKNGDDTNSGLFETTPVKTLQRAGNVMRSLPADKEILGVTIFLWGSDPNDASTIYTDYNDLDTAVGAPRSSFIGQNNYRITSNPNSGRKAIISGHTYNKNDPRRVALFNRDKVLHFRPTLLYLEGNNITVDNIEFTQAAGTCLRISGNRVSVRYVHAYNTNSDALFHSGQDALFEYNYIHHVTENLTRGLIGDGIRTQFSIRPVIRYNVVHNVSSEGFNFDDGTMDGLMYLNDAYEIGYYFGWNSSQQTEVVTGNAYKLSASVVRHKTARNAAIANRAWRSLRGFFARDASDQVIIYNSLRDITQFPFVILGDAKILIGSNMFRDVANTGQYVQEGINHPRQRSNSWGNVDPNSQNLVMGLQNQTLAQIYKSTSYPSSAPAVGFTGNHLLPLESVFNNIGNRDNGWGRHVGPVNSVISALRSMTPQQIRDRIAVYR